MFAYVGLGNAFPHSSDRNDGGDDGVRTGWGRVGRRLGGQPFITFGYLPKASGKDRGCGRRPYLKADSRAPAEGGLCWRYVGFSWTYLALCCPYVRLC